MKFTPITTITIFFITIVLALSVSSVRAERFETERILPDRIESKEESIGQIMKVRRVVLKKLLNDDQKAIKKWLKGRGSGLIQPFSIAQRSADEFVMGVLITEAHALYRYSNAKIYKQNLTPDVRNRLTRGLINYYYRYGVPHDIDVSDAVARDEFTWDEFTAVKEEREDAFYYSVGLNPPRVRDVVRRDYGNMKYHFDIDEREEKKVRREALQELRDSGAPPCGQKSILGLIYNCGFKKIAPAP